MEYVDIVDEQNTVVGREEREQAIAKGLRYRSTKVIVKNSKDQYLIQKRAATKTVHPNKWDIGVAETVQSGENFEQAALRGVSEEIGVVFEPSKISFLFTYSYNYEQIKRLYGVFECTVDSEITIQEEEISEIRWIDQSDLINCVDTLDFSPGVKPILEKYLA